MYWLSRGHIIVCAIDKVNNAIQECKQGYKYFLPLAHPCLSPLSCVSMPQVPREQSQEAVIFPQAAAVSHNQVQGVPFVVKQERRDAPITLTLPLTKEPRVGAMVDAMAALRLRMMLGI